MTRFGEFLGKWPFFLNLYRPVIFFDFLFAQFHHPQKQKSLAKNFLFLRPLMIKNPNFQPKGKIFSLNFFFRQIRKNQEEKFSSPQSKDINQVETLTLKEFLLIFRFL